MVDFVKFKPVYNPKGDPALGMAASVSTASVATSTPMGSSPNTNIKNLVAKTTGGTDSGADTTAQQGKGRTASVLGVATGLVGDGMDEATGRERLKAASTSKTLLGL